MRDTNYNLYAHFHEQVRIRGSSELLCTADGLSFSYEDVDRESSRLAQFLTDSGAAVGDRITVQVEKSPQALCLYLACLRGGFVFHPLNTGYKAQELAYFIEDAEPRVIVCDPANESLFNSLLRDRPGHVYTLSPDGTGSLADAARDAEADFDIVTSGENDLAALLYSSGTTGVPKGIMLTHQNLLNNTRSLVLAWEFTASDRLLHALPIFHVHGLFVALGCVMLSGASMRWLPAYNARDVMRFLPECTVLMGVPTYYTRLLAEDKFCGDTCSNVRVFVSGSAPLLIETFREFERRTGHRILERYGMTETNMNSSNPLHGLRKPGTVGPPLPGVEIRIVDDAGNEVPTGDIGNLQVRGGNVFVGYWKLPDKTAEDIAADGWFNTGDNGCIDEDGYVSIVGRAKDMVITGGLNVYPKEIELFLDDMPGVLETAVIGIPHPDFGEAVVAVVVREAGCDIGERNIVAKTKEALANFKVPKRVVFAEALPRNTMSKVQKNVLREAYADLFD